MPAREGRGFAGQRERNIEEEHPPDFDAAEPTPARREFEALGRQIREAAAAEVKSALSKMKTANPAALAQVLKAELQNADAETVPTTSSTLETLADIDGDGMPELVFKWLRAERFPIQNPDHAGLLPDWILFLLAWDGASWRASKLIEGDGLYDLEVLPRLGSAPALAVIEGITLAPYPVVFRIENHAAALAWDSRGEESRYQSLAGAEVEFENIEGIESPVMVVSGKADPGFLFFRRAGRRGFLAMTVYTWDGKAYVPRRTEFSANEDYVLYRFISALHLRDYRAAYALIDPSRFLKTREPSPEVFQKQMEESWPEFLKNNIFQATDNDTDPPGGFSFELSQGGKVYVYRPTFSEDAERLLTGLSREEK
ncbi:MAG: hypothetical protein HYS33_00480 [Acidobacteria bacterium]|nr:hypothetical protein [Acidobacteriota bacterium]